MVKNKTVIKEDFTHFFSNAALQIIRILFRILVLYIFGGFFHNDVTPH